jgi:phage tail sheath protein FI
MGFQLSPGVNVSEIDLTTVIPSVSTTAGAIVGDFAWGPANTRILVDSEITLTNTFGKPDSNTFVSFFTAANFLSYGNNLRVVRVVDSLSAVHANNASSVGTGLLIENESDYELNFPVDDVNSDGYSNYGGFYSRYPGDLGNSLRVEVCTGSNTFTTWAWNEFFSGAPDTSIYATNKGGSNDEMHIVVIDEDGKISGTANTVLETFESVSKASDARNDDGSPNYYVTQILNKSKWIYVANHSWGDWGLTADTTFGKASTILGSSLSGGLDVHGTTSSYAFGWDLFKNTEEVDVSLLIAGNASEKDTTTQNLVAQIAFDRKDAVAFLSPSFASSVSTPNATGIVAYRNSLNAGTSYAFMDSGWKYQFDKYNNVYRWVPLNGDTAGLCVYTDSVRDPWWSPAGLNRGRIKNVVKLSWNPNKTDRDTLYVAGVNPVVSFPGEGVVLYGDKTMQTKPSAFDRINVRRLFIVLEKAIATASKYSLFEFNDEFTRAQFVSLVEPFLRDVKGRRGIYDYRVVCDSTNNTPQVIDSNQFVGDIYIKPARSINFIQLNFVAVRTGVEFNEIVGKF